MIVGRSRDACIKALTVTQGNTDMAFTMLFEGADLDMMYSDHMKFKEA